MTDELKAKKAELRAMKREDRKRLGNYAWGDHHRRQRIAELEGEIRRLQSLPNDSALASAPKDSAS